MKIAVASDTHGMWDSLNYPAADVLVFAGDILRNYSRDRHMDAHQQLLELDRLNDFAAQLIARGDYKHIVLVAGNHDFVFQRINKEARKALTNITYLQDEEVIIDGVKFYGSPWQPWFYDWAFNFPNPGINAARARSHARVCWAKIPSDTNVLITHGPPKDILDAVVYGDHVGCPYLRDRVDSLEKLKLHCFGHIHYSYGIQGHNPIFLNAAVCGENYKPDNPIRMVNI
jgi:Icc-related predicted phosphoesterase